MPHTPTGAILPGQWRRGAASAAVRLLARVQELWPFRPRAFTCQGVRGEHVVRILCFGSMRELAHVLRTVLPNQPISMSKARHRDLRGDPESVDLIIKKVNVFATTSPGFHRLPARVRMIRELHSDEGGTSRVRYRERRALAVVEAAGVRFQELRVRSSPEMLEAFYRTLYSPHIRAIGGHVESFSRMKFLYPDGLLRLAFVDEKLIAGSLFLESGDKLISCKYGVLDPTDPVHRAAASLQLQVAHARRMGYRVFDGFHAGPFLTDGVFQKREAGLRVRPERDDRYWRHDVAVRLLRMSPAIVDLLRCEPYLRIASDGSLVAVVAPAVDEDFVAGTLRAYAKCKTGGIARYEFVVARPPTPEETSELRRHDQTLADLVRFVVVPIDHAQEQR